MLVTVNFNNVSLDLHVTICWVVT